MPVLVAQPVLCTAAPAPGVPLPWAGSAWGRARGQPGTGQVPATASAVPAGTFISSLSWANADSVGHCWSSPCVTGEYRMAQHGRPGSRGGAALSWNAETLSVPLCHISGSRCCLLPLLLTLRSSLSILSTKCLLGLVHMEVLLNEYWQVWLMHTHRRRLHKFCHLTEGSAERVLCLSFLSKLSKFK